MTTGQFWLVVGISLAVSLFGTLILGPLLRRRRLSNSRRANGLPDDD